ncbi:MAG: hypothetical protein J6W75_10195 [Bacteroidaceae bacterium]|nr:hypothetical protein [Bacteroidaceae bacterium]
MKKIYLIPKVHVVNVEPHAHLLDGSPVQRVSSQSTGITYGGGSNTAARVKDRGGYNVWGDD